MRLLRYFSCVLFALSLAAFCFYQYRERRVLDNTPPVIQMPESSMTVSTKTTLSELLSEISAEDDRDGDVTDSLVVESISNFVEKKTRVLTVAAMDSAGNIAKASCEIVYEHYKPARFQLSQPLRFPMGTTHIVEVLTAEDRLDGDISSRIKISGEGSLSSSDPGDYPMTFSVTNSAGDVSKINATVTLYVPAEENKKPQITLSKNLIYIKKGKKIDPWDYVSELIVTGQTYERQGNALESRRGAVYKSDFHIENGVDSKKPGSYEIVYSYAEDEGSEPGIARLIVVVEG